MTFKWNLKFEINHNLVKLYVHCEINETIEMTFKIETKLDTWNINCKFKKIFWKKKNFLKNFWNCLWNFFWKTNFFQKFFFWNFLEIFFFWNFFEKKKKISKKFLSKKISKKKKFLKNFKKFFFEKNLFSKIISKIFQKFFFSKNRICQTEFSNATKHLQKSNRHKESFFPTLACVTWPDLSPEL